jgi:hypothetical protein
MVAIAIAAVAIGCADEPSESGASHTNQSDAGENGGKSDRQRDSGAVSMSDSGDVYGTDAAVDHAGGTDADASVANPDDIDAGMTDSGATIVPEAQSCVAQHPRTASLDPMQLAEAVSQCQTEWRLCTASAPCNGMDKDHLCDASRFISAEAALCIARSAGLQEGFYGPLALLTFDNHVVWYVQNTLHDDKHGGPEGESDGEWLQVDAISGEASEIGGWGAIP